MPSSPASGCSAAVPPVLRDVRRFSLPGVRFSGFRSLRIATALAAHASTANSPDFVKRIERAWLISKQPKPVPCSSCESTGSIECKWCKGTGFFILGDNMLCEVPSKNTTCKICAGKGYTSCSDCKGTGFKAKWIEDTPPTPR